MSLTKVSTSKTQTTPTTTTTSTNTKKASASSTPASNPGPSSNWKALRQNLQKSLPIPSTSPKPATSSRKRKAIEHTSTPTSATARPAVKVRITEDVVETDFPRGWKGKEREDDGGEGSSVTVLRKTEVKTEDGAVLKDSSALVGILGTKRDNSGAPGRYLAIDCEMVGVGPLGSESILARVSIVNYHGSVVMDRFVRPREKVTDFRTWISGIREGDLRDAPHFNEVQKEVADLIKDRILVGHAVHNDLTALLLTHPGNLLRDTQKHKPLQQLAKTKLPGLKKLARLVLSVDIQSGEHSSVDDARATMAIYRAYKPTWESGGPQSSRSRAPSAALVPVGATSTSTTTTAATEEDVDVNVNGKGEGGGEGESNRQRKKRLWKAQSEHTTAPSVPVSTDPNTGAIGGTLEVRDDDDEWLDLEIGGTGLGSGVETGIRTAGDDGGTTKSKRKARNSLGLATTLRHLRNGESESEVSVSVSARSGSGASRGVKRGAGRDDDDRDARQGSKKRRVSSTTMTSMTSTTGRRMRSGGNWWEEGV